MIVGAIQQVRCAGEALAVDQHPVGALRVLGRSGGQAGGERDHAGRHQLEVGKAPIEDRQVRDHAVRVSRGNIAAFRLQGIPTSVVTSIVWLISPISSRLLRALRCRRRH